MNPDHTAKRRHPDLLYWVFRSLYYLCRLLTYGRQICIEGATELVGSVFSKSQQNWL